MNQDENLDPNGEIRETPTDPQSEITTTGAGETVNSQGAGTQSPEEASWNSLSGPSQDRFRQMARKLNEALVEKEAIARQRVSTEESTPVNKSTLAPDQRDAVRKLNEDFGIATNDYVNKTVNEKLQQSISGIVYQMELDKIEGKFDGSNGLPAFNRDEYEAFVATHPQYRNYTPEDVYEKMFPAEVMAFRVQNFGKRTTQRPTPSLRPTRTQVREEQWTPEAIEARLNQPDGPEWYNKNITLVNSVLARTSE